SLLSCHESYRTLLSYLSCFFFNAPSPTSIYTLSLHDALPICEDGAERGSLGVIGALVDIGGDAPVAVRHRPRRVRRQRDVEAVRSEEHTSELQSLTNLVCRLLLEKKKQRHNAITDRTLCHSHS